MNEARTAFAAAVSAHLATSNQLAALLPAALAERAAEISPAARTLVLDSDHPGDFYVIGLLDEAGASVLPDDFDFLDDELVDLSRNLRTVRYDRETGNYRFALPALAGAR